MTEITIVAIKENRRSADYTPMAINLMLGSKPCPLGPLSMENEEVNRYVRPGPEERCPAQEFLESLERRAQKKFMGAFNALVSANGGTDIPVMPQRYKPLTGDGKPLWEFKEDADRIYCSRTIYAGNKILITLFNGWTKGKDGRTNREDTEISKAKTLYQEFLPKTGGAM